MSWKALFATLAVGAAAYYILAGSNLALAVPAFLR
jgi:hypothetical protein